MTKDEIITALVQGEFDQEQAGLWKLSDDMYDLAVGLGTDFVWHGKMKAGTYFYFYTDNEELVEKYDWNIYGARIPEDKERRDAGFKEYVCLAYLHE